MEFLKRYSNCVLLANGLLFVLSNFGSVFAHSTLEVKSSWIQIAANGSEQAVGYLTLENTGNEGDQLVGAETPRAQQTILRQMVQDGALLKLKSLSEVALPSKSQIELKSGGPHLFFSKLISPLNIDDHIWVTLKFAHASPIRVLMHVSDQPIGHSHAHDDDQAHSH